MEAPNLFLVFTGRLDRVGIPYMVTGSVAVIVYGEPRLTHDIDLVLALRSDVDAKKLEAAFPDEMFYCPPLEIINVERKRPSRGHFNIIAHETGFKADIYPVGNDSLHQWAMKNRRQIELAGHPIWIAPPEYVIVRKLEYFREGQSEKHLADIASMLRVSGATIDCARIEDDVRRRGLGDEWHRAEALV